jgi:hypothetical protein
LLAIVCVLDFAFVLFHIWLGYTLHQPHDVPAVVCAYLLVGGLYAVLKPQGA